jgi:hypothetical protein
MLLDSGVSTSFPTNSPVLTIWFTSPSVNGLVYHTTLPRQKLSVLRLNSRHLSSFPSTVPPPLPRMLWDQDIAISAVGSIEGMAYGFYLLLLYSLANDYRSSRLQPGKERYEQKRIGGDLEWWGATSVYDAGLVCTLRSSIKLVHFDVRLWL